MNGIDLVRRALVLRQTFKLNGRLNLEFQAMLSKLLREYGVPVEDDLLKELLLAVPDELMGGGQPGSRDLKPDPLRGPQPPPAQPGVLQADTAVLGPQPPNLGGSKPANLGGPQPPNVLGPQPPNVLGPQPPNVLGPQPPPAELGPQPPPAEPEAGPQPPNLGGPQPPA